MHEEAFLCPWSLSSEQSLFRSERLLPYQEPCTPVRKTGKNRFLSIFVLHMSGDTCLWCKPTPRFADTGSFILSTQGKKEVLSTPSSPRLVLGKPAPSGESEALPSPSSSDRVGRARATTVSVTDRRGAPGSAGEAGRESNRYGKGPV